MLNGMFAFVVYDKRRQTLFAARDRYGIKPFYYSVINGVFYLLLNKKQFMNIRYSTTKWIWTGWWNTSTFQNILTDRTFEKSIKILQPGHYFTIDLNRPPEKIAPCKYWDFLFEPQERYISETEYEQELDEILSRAINRQLVSDAPVGCFLSGGMDSGTITCIASRKIPHINTFTCGYDMSKANPDEIHFDERKLTEIMAHKFQTTHFERVLQPGDIERVLPMVCYHNEEPRVGMTYTNYTISELASKFVKVCFSGTGGDELFGGYPWRYYRGMMASSYDEFADNYYTFWQRLVPTERIAKAFGPVWGNITTDPKTVYRQILGGQGRNQKQRKTLSTV